MRPYIYTFIPIFVALDIIGIIPVYVGLTRAIPEMEQRKIAVQSIVTAFIISIAFLFVGKSIFKLLGITVADFQIAGGALLFVIAIRDLVRSGEEPQQEPSLQIGVVPIGTPLLMGPAVLTVLIMMVDLYGLAPTMVSVLVNLAIVALVLFNAPRLLEFVGESGAKGMAKVIGLLLAAIGVMMIRRGIISIIIQMNTGLKL
ncbi:MAG: MarC family protein [Candidatus Lindowbacteria bacterium]|nr:MarC family protein [Candidatus Lindowbacteria bacterium]